MSSILANFDNFANEEEKVKFLNEVLAKQIALSQGFYERYPDNLDFYRHLQMLIRGRDSHFTTYLAKRLSGELTINEFSEAFADLLSELLENILIN